ncbi:MAG: hypothetical protein VW876_07710, partial [Deltaproteobacteria bacterium]
MAKQPNENKDTPNVNLLKIQQELEELAKEVLAMEGKGFFAKLGLGKKTKEVTPATGTDILEIAFLRGDKEINKLVSQLSGDPQNQAIRMQMVGRALQMEGRPQLEVARALLIHSCLPFYWGEVTGPAVQMLLRTFKLYLERILQIHKEKMMAIQSNVLKGVNLSGIEVNEDDMEDSGVGNRAGMMMEIKICEGLLEKINEASTTLQNKMGVSLSKYELDLALGKGGGGGMFGSEGSDINVEQVQGIVTTKIMHSIDMIKLIPMMNSAGLSLAEKMKEIESSNSKKPSKADDTFMQLILECPTITAGTPWEVALTSAAPPFNAAVVAYRRSMNTVSQSLPKKQDLPALAEFANLTYYGYINRQIMRLDKEGLKKLLQAGKDAADAAMTVDESYAPMQARLLRACNSMGMGLS